MTFDLPMPPSVNEMYVLRAVKGKTGRSLGFGYRKWRDSASSLVKHAWREQGEPLVVAPLRVCIGINLNRRSDIDNRVKACLDVLGKAVPFMPDDRWIDDLRIYRDPTITGARIHIESMEGAAI